MDQTQIDPQIQQKLNTPPVNPKGLSQEDQAFLNQLLRSPMIRKLTLCNRARL